MIIRCGAQRARELSGEHVAPFVHKGTSIACLKDRPFTGAPVMSADEGRSSLGQRGPGVSLAASESQERISELSFLIQPPESNVYSAGVLNRRARLEIRITLIFRCSSVAPGH